jgi:hypothetical protein
VGQKLIVGFKTTTTTQKTVVTTEQPKTEIKNPAPKVDEDRRIPGPDGTEIVSKDGKGDYIDKNYQKQYDDFQKKLEDSRKKQKTEWKEIEESVKGSSIDDGTIVSEKNLALHATAPPGTIMLVTNPMNGKSVYVKVIASFPKSDDENGVTIKITKTAAQKLGIRDENFRLDLHYGMEIPK